MAIFERTISDALPAPVDSVFVRRNLSATATASSLSRLVGNGSMPQMSEGVTMAIVSSVQGNLVEEAVILNARALNSTTIRIDFSKSLLNDPVKLLALNDSAANPNLYTISSLAGGTVAPLILSVLVPAVEFPTFVELKTSEMTAGASNYDVFISWFDVDEVPINVTPFVFSGIGIAPTVQLVIATSKNTVNVHFSEAMKDAEDIRDDSFYTFDNGLTVLAVTSLSENVLTLETSDQTEDLLYTLTIASSTMFDNANNALVTPVGNPMLGFSEAPDATLALRLRMYFFIIEGLRIEDQRVGNKFLERYLEGPQAIWEITNTTILALPNLWSVTTIPDELLPFLKNIVGWTEQLAVITDDLDALTLRRLIAASVRFWKQRGPEDAIEDIIRLTTGARLRILNWFDFRWIIGETQLGEEHDGNDPWVVSLPGETTAVDEQTYQIRIVDNNYNTLNRSLVRSLAKLTRPIGERCDILYLTFMDLFTVPNDTSQWDEVTTGALGSITPPRSTLVVADGVGTIPNTNNGEFQTVNSFQADDWTNYVLVTRMSVSSTTGVGGGFGVYVSGGDDGYFVRVTTHGTKSVTLLKYTSGTPTTLDSKTGVALLGLINSAVFNTYKIEATTEGSSTRLKLFVDNVLLLEALDADHLEGTIAMLSDADCVVKFDDSEVFFVPVESDFIDVNS